jgi:hypothetical protein
MNQAPTDFAPTNLDHVHIVLHQTEGRTRVSARYFGPTLGSAPTKIVTLRILHQYLSYKEVTPSGP